MSTLTPTYTCSICRQTFQTPGPPIIGEKPTDRMNRTMGLLAEHLGTVHKEQFAQIYLAGNQLAGWIMAQQFQHNDADIAREADKTRKHLRHVLKKVSITDQMILAQVTRHLSDLQEAEQQKVQALLITMRDSLEEVPTTSPPPTV